jgi:hypothetical protein
MGVRDLTGSRHATSEDSSDANHHADHRCVDGVHVHCDDGVDLGGGVELCGHYGHCAYGRQQHEHAPEIGLLWRAHESLNDSCNGDGETDYGLQGLGEYVVRCEHSTTEQTLQDFR